MTDEELNAALENKGYVLETQGMAPPLYRKGNIVVSGADCDLPSEHWYTIAIYTEWFAGSEVEWFQSDYSGVPGFEDQDGPRDFWADLALAEARLAADEDY